MPTDSNRHAIASPADPNRHAVAPSETTEAYINSTPTKQRPGDEAEVQRPELELVVATTLNQEIPNLTPLAASAVAGVVVARIMGHIAGRMASGQEG